MIFSFVVVMLVELFILDVITYVFITIIILELFYPCWIKSQCDGKLEAPGSTHDVIKSINAFNRS